MVDLIQRLAEHEPMMLGHAAFQRRTQRRLLGLHALVHQLDHLIHRELAFDQRLKNGAAALAHDVGGH